MLLTDASPAWKAVLKSALLGTARGADPTVPDAPGKVGHLLQAACLPAALDAEARLLRQAGIVGTAGLAGAIPVRRTAPAAPAPAETVAPCSARASALLARMLAGEHADALPEWLASLASVHRRVPHRHLVALLEHATRQPDVRPLLRPVVGQRGSWLMGQNASWQFDSLEDDATAFDTGARSVRVAAFHRMRQGDPAAARAHLEASWPQEAPEDRVVLLRALATRLHADDEPFLEAALDDRRKEVRQAAASLLTDLPGSRLQARMQERVRALVTVTVTVKKRLFGLAASARQVGLDVTLPEACDKAMIRDGIEPKPRAGVGEKAWWLEQMLAAVPPDTLRAEGDLTPEELVEVATRSEWADTLLRGWCGAAARHQDPRWASLMLKGMAGRPEDEHDPAVIGRLAAALPGGEREKLALEVLRPPGVPVVATLPRTLLLACDSWSTSLTREVISALRADVSWDYRFREVADDFALRMDPALAPALFALVEEVERGGGSARALTELGGMLEFRKDMREAIRAMKESHEA